MRIILSLTLLGLLVACSENQAPSIGKTSPETVCAKQGFAIGSPEFDQCVSREKGYRQLEELRKQDDKQEFYRDFDRARRF